VKVVTREFQHTLSSFLEARQAGLDVLRGGVNTADHVDIMGNFLLLEDIIRIATGNTTLENRIYSNVEEISAKINLDT
jgi:phospholipid:diacylglycerol acyltransferase